MFFFEKVKEIADAEPQLAKRYSSYFERVREIADTNPKLAESLQRKAVSEFFETFPDTAERCWPALMELEKRICAMLDTETTMESNDDIYIINAIIEMMVARKCPNEELFAFFMKNMPKLASYSLDIPLHSNQIWIPFCQFDFEQQGQ